MTIEIRSFALGVCRLTLGLGLAILGIYRAYMVRWSRNSNRASTGPEYAESWGPPGIKDIRRKGEGERHVGVLDVSENLGTLYYGKKFQVGASLHKLSREGLGWVCPSGLRNRK